MIPPGSPGDGPRVGNGRDTPGTAVARHRTLEAIQKASDTGARQKL